MGLFDKILGKEGDSSSSAGLGKVTEEDHRNALIKERPDLCKKLSDLPADEVVKRDGKIDITFKGWQICNVEERHNKDDRRLGYLKLFKTRNDKFVCQRMTLIDNEEKQYIAATVEDFPAIRNFFGEDSLAQALYVMLDRVSKDW
ncbi:MAG: hypothetical protein J6I35_06795 [Ruminobacter sp.]|jgi:hypothetical protein|uniref:hypothetical protein n=1 Tax=Ruminobacter sp. TaxID=2774296 RepID=UPI001B5E027D|nr:hypothetical protein [Ruminobacter sp.]MBP3749240.1 hypothetical protein [Ruminobacter sp.]